MQIRKSSSDLFALLRSSSSQPPQTAMGSNVCPAGLQVPVKTKNKHMSAAEQPGDQPQTFKAQQRVSQTWGEMVFFVFFTPSLS